MHQCDYCCWYNPKGHCDCPSVMKMRACDEAYNKASKAKHKTSDQGLS